MIAKTIEGMFHPWSLKMRHEIFNNNRGPGGGGGVGGGVGEGGSQQQQGAGTATVRGKSRDDIQRKIVEILREVGREALATLSREQEREREGEREANEHLECVKGHEPKRFTESAAHRPSSS